MTISAGTLSIKNTGQLGSPTFGAGNGGNVSVNVAGLLNIDGSGNTTQFLTGIAASVQPGSSGNAGSVVVDAGALSIIDGVIFNGAVGAMGTAPASIGNAGNITVNVTGSLSIQGPGSGIVTPTDVGTRGNAGNIVVTAGSLSIDNFGTITAFTAGAGQGGSVTVSTAGSLGITNYGSIQASTYGSGTGGDVDDPHQRSDWKRDIWSRKQRNRRRWRCRSAVDRCSSSIGQLFNWHLGASKPGEHGERRKCVRQRRGHIAPQRGRHLKRRVGSGKRSCGERRKRWQYNRQRLRPPVD